MLFTGNTKLENEFSKGESIQHEICDGVLRLIHTRGFAPRACSRLILHMSVDTRESFQVRSICPGSLLPNI